MFRDSDAEFEELDRDLADETGDTCSCSCSRLARMWEISRSFMAPTTGWKKIHGDVFRQPPAFVTLCVMVAVGHQLLFLTFACVTVLHPS